jgi:uroporphyrinogen-III synthase
MIDFSEVQRIAMSPPLSSRTIVVTRPERQARELSALFEAEGARVVLQPTIAILPPESWQEVDARLQRLPTFDWVVFTSSNGVREMMTRAEAIGIPSEHWHGVRIAAIGSGTARALRQYGKKVDCMPKDTFRAESLAELLAPEVKDSRVLQVRGSRGRAVLTDRLEQAGAEIVPCRVYRSVDVREVAPEVEQAYARGEIDWTTVTSPAIGRSLRRLLGDDLWTGRLAAISPLTAETLREQGTPAAIVSEEATMESLVAAIVEWEKTNR